MRSLPELPIVYTRHAKGRMRWRRITPEEIATTLRAPDRLERIAPNRAHAWKTITGRTLRVIAAIEHDRIVIITAMEQSS